jgi:hypothetical protein
MPLPWVVSTVLLGLGCGMAAAGDDEELKLADCPPAVRKTLQAEAKGSPIEGIFREKGEDGDATYWADITLGGRAYSIGVLENGTLSEMNLAVDDEEVAFDRCPAAVQEAFRAEAFGARIETVSKDIRYGVTIYEAVVEHRGKSYEVIVAEDGTLVEKVLVIDDEEIELGMCPAAVRATFHEQSRGGTLGEITRTSGINGPTYEADIEIRGRVYLVEVAESGLLISKSLEAGPE